MSNSLIKSPLVSVLIPVYNGTEYLDQAIESVLNSTYKKVEIILVDDGSSDQSRKKCLGYSKKYKHISFYGFRKNKGMTRCLNFGVKKARGKYIARLNQDDIMVKDRLEKQVKFLESRQEYVIVGGAIKLFTQDNPQYDVIKFPKTDSQIRDQWMILSPYSDPTVMYRKDAWLQTDGYSQYFWPADDVHMWYQLGMLGKMANLQTVLTQVRWHSDCGSIKSHSRQMKKTWAVHQWAAECIQAPSFGDRVFWIAELTAGYLFPAQFNWWVYRVIRHVQTPLLRLLNDWKRLISSLTQFQRPVFSFEK
ncbi:MAG: glycosyltransferase family A protein [Patescibacteria group bacterium]